MEIVLILVVGLLVFAVGPLAAVLHFLSREIAREQGPGVGLLRLAGGLLVLWIPFAWIVYFVLSRREPPLD